MPSRVAPSLRGALETGPQAKSQKHPQLAVSRAHLWARQHPVDVSQAAARSGNLYTPAVASPWRPRGLRLLVGGPHTFRARKYGGDW